MAAMEFVSAVVSPRKAEHLALGTLAKLMGTRDWTTPNISLQAFDVTRGASDHREIRWIYVLQFRFLGIRDNEGGYANIIVLMDGAVVEPKQITPLNTGINTRNGTNAEMDKELTGQIVEALAQCQTIKIGMTRAQLSRIFTTEGGISTAIHRIYIYIRCPYIKVDVDFKLSAPTQGILEEKPTDTITKISKPYLDRSVID